MNGPRRWPCLAAGSFSLAANQWLTLWLLAHTAPSDMVGSYGLAVGLAAVICALAGLQLRALMATESRLAEQLPAYFALRALPMAVLGMSLAPLFLMGVSDYTSSLIGAVLLSRIAELGSDFVDGLRLRDRSYLALAVSQCTRSAAAFAAFAVVWMASLELRAALIAAAMAALLSAAWIDLPALRKRRIFGGGAVRGEQIQSSQRGAHAATRKILVFAVPLAMVHFLNMGVLVLPRLLLGGLSTLESVAAFTCLTPALGIVSLLSSAYSAGFAPDFADAFDVPDSRPAQGGVSAPAVSAATSGCHLPAGSLMLLALRNTALVLTPLAVLLAAAGEPALRWVYGSSIAFPVWAIRFTAIFALLWGLSAVFGTAATAARRIKLQVGAFSLSLGGGALAGVALIPAYGVVGASASLVVSAVILLSSYFAAFRTDLVAPRRRAVTAPAVSRFGAVAD